MATIKKHVTFLLLPCLIRNSFASLFQFLMCKPLWSGSEIAKYEVKSNKLSIFVQNVIKKLIKCKVACFAPRRGSCRRGGMPALPLAHFGA